MSTELFKDGADSVPDEEGVDGVDGVDGIDGVDGVEEVGGVEVLDGVDGVEVELPPPPHPIKSEFINKIKESLDKATDCFIGHGFRLQMAI